MEKIRDNQQFIDSIYTRMGIAPLPPISSVAMPIPSVPADIQEGMFDIQEEDEGPSEGQNDGESSEGQKSSNGESQESNIVSSSSEQSSLKTYYSLEELDWNTYHNNEIPESISKMGSLGILSVGLVVSSAFQLSLLTLELFEHQILLVLD